MAPNGYADQKSRKKTNLFLLMISMQKQISPMGPSIKYVRKIFGIFDPLPPLVRILARFVRLNSRNLPYYICFWVSSPLPLGAYVLNGCPLMAMADGWISDHQERFALRNRRKRSELTRQAEDEEDSLTCRKVCSAREPEKPLAYRTTQLASENTVSGKNLQSTRL